MVQGHTASGCCKNNSSLVVKTPPQRAGHLLWEVFQDYPQGRRYSPPLCTAIYLVLLISGSLKGVCLACPFGLYLEAELGFGAT